MCLSAILLYVVFIFAIILERYWRPNRRCLSHSSRNLEVSSSRHRVNGEVHLTHYRILESIIDSFAASSSSELIKSRLIFPPMSCLITLVLEDMADTN